MIAIQMSPNDLVKMRFAYRPLLEISDSYRVLSNPEFQSPYRRWLEEAHRAVYDIELPYLQALVPPSGYIPDFLSPTPTTKLLSIENDLEEVLATPDLLIQANVQTLIDEEGDSEVRRHFVAHPRDAVHCLVENMRVYWQRTLAHHWQRMIAVLESDILYRGRMLALDGPGVLFGDLHSTVAYRDNQLQISSACSACKHRHDNMYPMTSLGGDGIQLVPTIFAGCGRSFQFAPQWRSMLSYGTRGAALWWRVQQDPNRTLELALGTGRAQVLQVLRTPASTGELAHRLGVSAGAVSQHLHRLTRAGLVEPHRVGKRVYYHLTWRGEELLNLFDRTS